MELLPHQIAFVDTFFSPASKRVILLRGEVGLGKSRALVALASRLLRERPTARVLFVVPGSALRAHFVAMLRDAGVQTLSVDRYQYREMLDSQPGQDLWPAGFVAVMSREFARQEDIRDALATARWDLLVVDEAHQFRGALAGRALRQVGGASDRVVLATLPNLDLPDAFTETNATVVQWRRDQVVDHNGALLDAVPRPILHEVSFSVSPAELSLAATVGELCRIFEGGTTQQRWVARSLMCSLQSSPAAIERALRRIVEIRNRVAHDMEPLQESTDDDSLEERFGGLPDLSTAQQVAGAAVRALSQIEAIDRDSKLGAFSALLSRLCEERTPTTRICVVTEYVGTLFYLAAEIESLGQTCYVFHGDVDAESRQNALVMFSQGGGILTATIATMSTGFALPGVTDLILYDIPASEFALQQVLGRFDRFGRSTQLNVYALVSSNRADDFVSESRGLLCQTLGSPLPSAHK